MAKHEMRDVLYKHQMSVMKQQMRPYSAYQNQNQSSVRPPVTPAANNRMISPMQSSSTSSFDSPPHTPMPQSQNSWLWELEKQQSQEKNNDYSFVIISLKALFLFFMETEEL